MGQLHVHEFITVDGVFEDPSFTMPYGFPDRLAEVIGSITGSSKSILLGRRTFEMFAPAWSARTIEDDPGAPFFNDTDKYVVSETLNDPAAVWRNSEALGGYDPQRIADLKEHGDVYVSGSGRLVRAMLADQLVDELHLIVYPVVLGAGARLFDGLTDLPLQLIASESVGNGILHLSYGPVQNTTSGTGTPGP